MHAQAPLLDATNEKLMDCIVYKAWLHEKQLLTGKNKHNRQ